MIVSTSCSSQEETTPLQVFIAGSLMVPFEALEQAYEALYPEVDVPVEAHGSIQVIRHITEIQDLIDVVVSADYALIPMLMYANSVPESGEPYANWYIKFASNRLVLAYIPMSRAAEEITAENWYEIIARPGVKFGLSDPRFDADGYRSLMIVQLAEEYYGNPTIFERIYLGRFKEPITVEKVGSQQIIHVPELLETTPESNIVMRGGSVALLALLESGDTDYAFEYESVARQHGLRHCPFITSDFARHSSRTMLKVCPIVVIEYLEVISGQTLRYLELPAEHNLSDPAQAADYVNVQVKLDFQRFSSVKPEFNGEVIAHGITIPSNALNPQSAQDFVEFLLGPQGAAIMDRNSHPIFDTPQVDNCPALPENITSFCSP